MKETTEQRRERGRRYRAAHPGQHNTYLKEWREQNREKVSTYRQTAYDADPDKFKARSSKWRAENPEKWRAIQIAAEMKRRARKSGWTPEMYVEAYARQQGLCAICGLPEQFKKMLAADHDHASGKPRELLCHRCNLRLSDEHDEELWLEAALAYVRKHKAALQ